MRSLFSIRRAVTATALALAGLAFVPVLLEAILVAPHAVFMDHRSRSAQMYLVNNGTLPEEVSIELRYGYPDSDSLGGVYVKWVEPDSTTPSAAQWIRAFPRRTVVQPGERQSVRLLAQPPFGLQDGEYWSRLIVTSREIRQNAQAGDSAVRAGVDVELRTILSLTYRKGALTTHATVTEFAPEMRGDTMAVWLGLHRDGNAAFLGTIQLEAHDRSGRTVGEFEAPVAVYYHVRRRFAFPIQGATANGVYTVKMRLSTRREDIPQDNVLPSATVVDSALVRAQ